jgi:hypothetical protein
MLTACPQQEVWNPTGNDVTVNKPAIFGPWPDAVKTFARLTVRYCEWRGRLSGRWALAPKGCTPFKEGESRLLHVLFTGKKRFSSAEHCFLRIITSG